MKLNHSTSYDHNIFLKFFFSCQRLAFNFSESHFSLQKKDWALRGGKKHTNHEGEKQEHSLENPSRAQQRRSGCSNTIDYHQKGGTISRRQKDHKNRLLVVLMPRDRI